MYKILTFSLSALSFLFSTSFPSLFIYLFIRFSKDKESLNNMREAEIKHCRLAMLGKSILYM